jgi:hypothetical protein
LIAVSARMEVLQVVNLHFVLILIELVLSQIAMHYLVVCHH